MGLYIYKISWKSVEHFKRFDEKQAYRHTGMTTLLIFRIQLKKRNVGKITTFPLIQIPIKLNLSNIIRQILTVAMFVNVDTE
jgi:hypothetical protein